MELLQTYCLGTPQRSATLVTLGEIYREEVAGSHLSRAIFVRVELSSHLKSLGSTAEYVVALVGVMEDDRD